MIEHEPDLSFEIIPEKYQGGDAWLRWRQKGMGSSDAPIIMGVSPWRTPHQLWQDKLRPQTFGTDEHQPLKPNFAQERGHRLEPIARSLYESTVGFDSPADVFELEGTPFRASLDGINADKTIGLEIKCPGRADHATAMSGQVPEKYIWQLCHQFHCVPTLKRIDYFSYFEPWRRDSDEQPSHAMVTVERDDKLIKKYVKAALKFWSFVETETEPPLTDRDWRELKDNRLIKLGEQYREAKFEADLANEKLNVIKAEIDELCNRENWRNVVCETVKVSTIKRAGAVEYKKIDELKKVDLDQYRKPATEYRKIEVMR